MQLGNCLTVLHDHRGALKQYDLALKMAPDSATALNNKGNALEALGKPIEAIAAYRRAITLQPDYTTAHVNLGNSLKSVRQFDAAADSYRRALAITPGHPRALFGLTLLRLSLGEWPGALADYEIRWHDDNRTTAQRFFAAPAWLNDRPIAGKTIFLHWEQGLGDAIQFCRYVPEVAALGARVILEAPRGLIEIMKTLDGVDQLVTFGSEPPPYHEYCPLMSLPLAFGTRLDAVPGQRPYLSSTPSAREKWGEILGRKERPRIGIAWRGNPGYGHDHLRSLPLHFLRPILALPVDFVALQFDVTQGERRSLAKFRNVRAPGSALGDFATTAGLLEHLDLVISVDTAIAHLAGAMGRPVNILLPYSADWRWGQDSSESPWYPTARLVRQDAFNDWQGFLGRTVERIRAKFLAGGGPGKESRIPPIP